MKKQSQIMGHWPKIYQKLKSPPPGVNLGSLPGKLPSMDKIKIDSGTLNENPQAIGYVSTEDSDDNGNLDVIHISSPKLEQAMAEAGLTSDGLSNIDSLSPEQLVMILRPFVELLSHEMGHLDDFSPDLENPFPGGEAVADSAAQTALNQISYANTNSEDKVVNNSRRNKMNSRTLKILSDLANELDKRGASKIADHAEYIMTKYSQDLPERPESLRGPQIADTDNDHLVREMREGVDRLGRSITGNITPEGDPYTYNLNPNKTFTVVTAPAGMERTIGTIISSGNPGYDTLAQEASRLGLMRSPMAKAAPIAEGPPEVSDRASRLISSLGLNTVPQSSRELKTMAEISENSFREHMKALAARIISEMPSGLFGGGGAAAAMVRQSIRPMFSDSLTGEMARRAWSNVMASGATLFGSEKMEVYNSGSIGFLNGMKKWTRAVQLRMLNAELFGPKISTASISEIEDEKSPSDISNEKIEKVASLKDEFRSIFYSSNGRPFNRSSAKFKR